MHSFAALKILDYNWLITDRHKGKTDQNKSYVENNNNQTLIHK